MLVSEANLEDIFEIMSSSRNFPWETPAHGSDFNKKLGLAFTLYFGDSTLTSYAERKIGEEGGKEQLCHILSTMFFDKWDNLYNTMILSLPVNAADDYKETVKEHISEQGTVSNDNSTTDKTSAYDVDTFSDKSMTTFTNAGNNSNERDRSWTKQGYSGSPVNNINRTTDFLTNRLLYDIVFLDIKSFLCLQIF